jgi:iron complex outermembrane recepter protein
LVTPASFPVSYDPGRRNTQLFSGFVQNNFTLPFDHLNLIIGTKLEHNDYTGFEIQPTIRLLWQPNETHMLWGAISRAVRTPLRSSNVRIDIDVLPGEPPTLVSVFGNPNALSEQLIAYELGYRMQSLEDRFFFDVSIFFNDYNMLRTLEPIPLRTERFPPPAHNLLPAIEGNNLEGETYGIEIAANFQLLERWNVNLAYSFLEMVMHCKRGSRDLAAELIEGDRPASSTLGSFRLRRHQRSGMGSLATLCRRLALSERGGLYHLRHAFGVDAS